MLVWKRKTRLLFGRLWNAVIKWKWSTATKVRSYSDSGTLSLLVHCSTDRWTIAYGTQLTTFSVWKYLCLKIVLIIVSLQSVICCFKIFLIISVIFSLKICLIIVSLKSVICLLIFTNHASFRDKICLCNILSSLRDSRGAPRSESPAGASPLDPTGAAPRTPVLPSTCTLSPVPPTTACQQWLKSLKLPISM